MTYPLWTSSSSLTVARVRSTAAGSGAFWLAASVFWLAVTGSGRAWKARAASRPASTTARTRYGRRGDMGVSWRQVGGVVRRAGRAGAADAPAPTQAL